MGASSRLAFMLCSDPKAAGVRRDCMTRCRANASRAATTSLLAAFDPVLYVSALSERGGFAGAATDAEVSTQKTLRFDPSGSARR